MAINLTFLGHSCFQIETGETTILIDPFLTGNPLAAATADDVNPDVIIVSHGHGDHVGDTVAIAKRCNSLVISNHEIGLWLKAQGVSSVHDMHLGGSHAFDFGTVKLTVAHHGSVLPDGTYGGNPAGILLKMTDGTIYHAADTALFSDMKLIGDEGLDVAILPIGDNYTMGPDDAVRAVKFLEPGVAIPCHWNTFPLISQDASKWASDVEAQTQARAVVLDPGQQYTV